MAQQNNDTPELDEKIFGKIEDLGDAGEALMDDGDFAKAAEKFAAAFALIPEPFQDWEASIWLLTSLAESYFLDERYKLAQETFLKALECPDAEDSPPILLRLGQCALELGDKDQAADYLRQAYEAEGDELFEDEDPKYYEFLNKVAEL